MNTIEPAKRPVGFPLLGWTAIAIALGFRALHVFCTQRYNPIAADLQLDAATYDRWARALAFGGDPGPTTLMQAPLYPWFLSIIYRVAGPSLAAVRLVQALLGTATCALIIYCTSRFFKSRFAAIVAGTIAALYAPLIFYEGILVPATLIVFLNVLFLAVIAGATGPRGTFRLIAAGIILGLSIVANPMSIIILPFVLLHLAFGPRQPDQPAVNDLVREHPRRRSRLITRSLALAAGLLVALAPGAIRNALRTGEFIPLTTGGGINFYIGNNPDATGFYAVPSFRGTPLGAAPEEQWRNMQELASRASGKPLSQSETSKFWFGAGLDFIRDEPRRWGALLWDKLCFFWNDYERANVENFYFHRRFPGVLQLPLLTFGLIAPLGLLGVFLTRNRRRSLWLLYGGILTYFIAALMFYVLARYRLPIVPFLAPFAGAAVAELIHLGRNRRIAELVLSLAALAVLLFFSNARVARDTPFGISTSFTRLGNAYVARGDTSRAVDAYREALKNNPRNAAAKDALSKLGPR